MNLVTDGLQRTCTGVVIINLEGSGWEEHGTDENNNNGDLTITTNGNGIEVPEVTTNPESNGNVNGNGNGNGIGQTEIYDNTGVLKPWDSPFDNVHFGPAGIGLLIMGFLVLGCKYINSPIYMCHPPPSPPIPKSVGSR